MTKKERLLEVASRLFAQKGYSATSIDEIAKASALSKAAIYYHFSDKAALYEEILASHIERMATALEQNVAEHSSQIEQLECYIRSIAKAFSSSRDFCSLLMRALANGGEEMPMRPLQEMLRTFVVLQKILAHQDGALRCKEPMLLQMMILGTMSFFLQTNTLRKKVVTHIDPTLPTQPDYTIEDATKRLTEMIVASMGDL
jgi:AcrR family transcriptional regulator